VCAAKVKVQQVHPLDGVVAPGRYGDPGADVPGVVVQALDGLDFVRVSPFAGHKRDAGKVVRETVGLSLPAIGAISEKAANGIAWVGDGAWLVWAPGEGTGVLHRKLTKAMKNAAAVVDQSHAFTAISLSGHRICDLLAKECSVDLNVEMFKPGTCALLTMAHTSVLLCRRTQDEFVLFVPIAFVESFWHWLGTGALEFGCDVKPIHPVSAG